MTDSLKFQNETNGNSPKSKGESIMTCSIIHVLSDQSSDNLKNLSNPTTSRGRDIHLHVKNGYAYTELLYTLIQSHSDQQERAQKFQEGAQTVQEGAHRFQEGAQPFQEGAQSVQKGAQTFQERAQQFQEGAQTIQEGTHHFQEGAQPFQERVQSVQEEAHRFQEEAQPFQEGAHTVQKGAQTFQVRAQQFQEGDPEQDALPNYEETCGYISMRKPSAPQLDQE